MPAVILINSVAEHSSSDESSQLSRHFSEGERLLAGDVGETAKEPILSRNRLRAVTAVRPIDTVPLAYPRLATTPGMNLDF